MSLILIMPWHSMASSGDKNTKQNASIIIVKLKTGKLDQWQQYIEQDRFKEEYTLQFGNTLVKRVFKNHKPIPPALKKSRPELVDLSLIYSLKPTEDGQTDGLMFRLKLTGLFDYVELLKPVELLYVPDDEKIGSQYYLDKIYAKQAWDVWKGDTNTIIGIVDSGTDLDHPDLFGNIAYNYLDPVDGIDNDNDGFVDNYHGWDLGDMDNDPQVMPGGGNTSHGVHICGIAAASTDNLTGVAGVGFNCRFLPVKINDIHNNYVAGYEGIVYAADHGCKVINCSWGSQLTAGKFGQDIINYATFNRDALVVAACGNSNNEIPFYPASYENVLSVGATGPSDERMVISATYGSSYGYFLDVCAPGLGIFNTWDYPYFYNSLSGTSMASAVVAGAAALVRSYFPEYSALQAAEKLRATTDRIDTLPVNSGLIQKLGSGRINLLHALSDTITPSLRMTHINFSDKDDMIFRIGDTLLLTGTLVNYLAVAHNVTVTLESMDPLVELIDNTITFPMLSTLDSVNTQNNPFRFVLSNGLSSDATVYFKIVYQGDGFSSFEFVRLDLNGEYLNIATSLLKTTLTSKGRIGFNDNWKNQGTGFCYKNDITRLYTGGLIMGINYYQVSDVLYNQSFNGWDQDFIPLEPVHKVSNSTYADLEFVTKYNDFGAGMSALGLLVTQRTLIWNLPEDSRFVVHEYVLKNISSADLANLYAGVFIDWDINEQAPNYDRVFWNNDHKMGVTLSVSGGPVAGISLLTEGPARQYAFDNDGNNGSIKITDGFSAQEKYTALKSFRPQAGTGLTGNNVSDLVASGPHLLLAGDSLVIAFALLAADQITDLEEAATRAKQRYFHTEDIPESFNQDFAVQIAPNPLLDKGNITFYLADPGMVHIKIIDIQGNVVKSEEHNFFVKGWNSMNIYTAAMHPGVYIIEICDGLTTLHARFVKI